MLVASKASKAKIRYLFIASLQKNFVYNGLYGAPPSLR